MRIIEQTQAYKYWQLLVSTLIVSSLLFTVNTEAKPIKKAKYCGQCRILSADYFGIEAWQTGFNRDPMAPKYDSGNPDVTEKWIGGAAMLFNLSLFEYKPNWGVYWNNRVHTDGTRSQLRTVGWQWDMYMSLGKKIDIFHHHHSQHLMDTPTQTGARFPVRDVFGIRFNFFERDDYARSRRLLTH